MKYIIILSLCAMLWVAASRLQRLQKAAPGNMDATPIAVADAEPAGSPIVRQVDVHAGAAVSAAPKIGVAPEPLARLD